MELITSIRQLFNNRELSIILWGVVFLIWMISQEGMRKSLGRVIKSFLVKSILLSILSMLIYIAVIVGFFYYLGVWDFSFLKDTIYWTFGVGFIMFINVNDAISKDNYFKKIVIDNFKLIVILQFITNLYFFNLILEIIFIPILLLFTMTSTYSENKKEYNPAKKFSDTLIAIYGFTVLIFSVYHAIMDFESINNIRSIKSFLLSPVLTILYIPFLYFMALFMAYESFMTSKKWILKENKKTYRFLKWKVCLKCRFRIGRMGKITKQLHVYSSISKTEIRNELKRILND